MGSAQGLIDVAYSYLGTTEDDPRFFELIDYYNEHTGGYDMRYWDEWCACFVSVCSIKSGNRDATGTNVNCAEFRRIWREKGIYREPWETPDTGWLIDYDWERDGIPDHIGIVADCDGSTIHVIEGNTDGEICAEHWIPVGSGSISCFAAPNYEEDDMSADQVWNHELQGPNASMPAGQRLVDIQAKFYDTTDYSGRGKEVPFIARLCWAAAKQEKQNDLLVAIAVKVGIPEEEARKMLDVEPSEEAKEDE